MTIDTPMERAAANVRSTADSRAGAGNLADPARRPITFMRRRFRLMRYIAAALLALTLSAAPATTPARADILDCVNLVVPPISDALQATDLAAHLAQCVGRATGGDVIMATTIAAMAVMAVAGVIPSDTDQCFAAVDGLLGALLATVLMETGIFDKESDIYKFLLQLAQGQLQLHNIPALAFVLDYANCGCYVVGAPEQIEELTDKFLSTAGGCAEVFEAAAGEVVDFLETVVCGAIEVTTVGLFGCEPAGGGDKTCYTYGTDAMVEQFAGPPPSGKCELGMQCNPCGWAWCGFADPHAFGISPGVCACPAPYTSHYGNSGQGKAGQSKLTSCTCDPPNQNIGGACLCPVNSQLKEGACVACTDYETYVPADSSKGQMVPACKPCGFGMKSNAGHTGCINACNNAAGEIFDHGQCVKCGEKQKAIHQIGSLGSCIDCAEGQKGSADRSTCIPACPPGQVNVPGVTIPSSALGGKDTKTSDSCFTCPENTFASYEGTHSSKGTCKPCLDGFHAFAGSTQCTPLDCGISGYRDPDNPHACKACPATQIYIPTAKVTVPTATGGTTVVTVPGYCGCGENQRLEGATCVCAAGAIKVNMPMAGGTLSGCMCPDGAHLDKATFSCVCAAGATLDPTGKTCRCPAAGRIEGDKCIYPSLQPVPLARTDCSSRGAGYINDPKNTARCIPCPRGLVANDTRTGCVAQRPSTGVIVPMIPAPPVGRAGPRRGDTRVAPAPLRPRLSCPQGTRPNAGGTACAPLPRFQPPAPRPLGVRPGGPVRPPVFRTPPMMRR
jgi:hypothetical protein